jgi:hypothetical protein
MLEQVPNLKFFSNAYWSQMGDEVYGNIAAAFRQFLADAAHLPDEGNSIRRELYGELMLILDSDAYNRWLKHSRTNIETIRAVGGRFIFPDQVRPLMAILDERFAPDA